ncbi:MAG: fibronectin type III domain-containing protein [Chloroflexi bacterium]|nr:fibronectin type III domain-containing protein [Chloroflexota bacterium]
MTGTSDRRLCLGAVADAEAQTWRRRLVLRVSQSWARLLAGSVGSLTRAIALSAAALMVALLVGWGLAGAEDVEGDATPETALTLESATPTSLTVTWDDVPNATLYSVRWRLTGQTAYSPSYAAMGGRYQITGLLPGRNYRVRIEVSGGSGVVFRILGGTWRTPLTAPEHLTVTAASASSLSLSWTKPDGWNPAGYRLSWRKPSDAQYLGSVNLASIANSHTVTALTDQTQYVVNLLALNDLRALGTETSVSAYAVGPLSVKLLSGRSYCTANTQAVLKWTIRGGLLPHRLFIGGQKIDLDIVESQSANCGPIPIDSESGRPVAEPSKTFIAQAKDKRGASATAEATVELVTPGAPTLSARTSASGSVALSWSIGSTTGLTHWEYRQRQDAGDWSAWIQITGSDSSTTEHKVSGLTEDGRYSFRLRAVSGSVAGPRSATITTVAGLTPTVPSDRETLRYNRLDSNAGAMETGSYSFLSDASDLTSGAVTFAEVSSAAALLVNKRGARDRDYSSVLDKVQVGDHITWFPFANCWYSYRVSAVLSEQFSRTLLLIESESERPCGLTPAQLSDTNNLDHVRKSDTYFDWNDPPNVPRIGPDGIRILPFGFEVEAGRSYRLGPSSPIVIDVPEGMRFIFVGVMLDSAGVYATYLDRASGGDISMSPTTGEDAYFSVPIPQGKLVAPPEAVGRFQALIASIRKVPLS